MTKFKSSVSLFTDIDNLRSQMTALVVLTVLQLLGLAALTLYVVLHRA